MATKTKKTTTKINKQSVAKKVNTSLVNASMAAINTTVDNGEKWQKLASKLIKKSEKVRQEQINMVFDTAEAVKGQFVSGTDRIKDLVGYDFELVGKAKDMATNNPVSKKVMGVIGEISEKVSENAMVQKAEKATDDLKKMGVARYMELKEDVLDQASKILDKGEAIIEDAKSTPKAKVTKKGTSKKAITKKVTATKAKATKATVKVAPKKTMAKKVNTTKATVTKVEAKTAPKTAVVKKATSIKATPTKATATKVAPAAKVAITEVKKVETANVAEVKTEASK
ncbi:MAG: hypothetical protein ACJA1B_000853 [Polaribacter sp.]|jgi:hypothetical protein|tara:strand:- start:10902 stop:11753 length:852 start_codon:yes stop_codon:yes gene_type:complete